MIGLMFVGAVFLWLVISLRLALNISKWLKIKPRWSALLAPILFFSPIGDELIAWPQVQKLCRSADGYHIAQGLNEDLAAGRTVKFEILTMQQPIFPSSVRVEMRTYRYSDTMTAQPVFEAKTYVVRRSFLGSIVGGYIMPTVFLSGCAYDEHAHQRYIENRLKALNIRLVVDQ